MWMMNVGKPVKIPPLNDAMVIELGANILGEIIIFLIAAVAVLLEVGRQRRKEENKERLRREELEKLRDEVSDITQELRLHEDEIVRLYEIIRRLETKPQTHSPHKGGPPKQNPQSEPPSKPSLGPSPEFSTVAASSEEPFSYSTKGGFSTRSPSDPPDYAGPSFLISVASSILPCTTPQLLYTSYIHAATVQTADARAKVTLAPSKKFCDFDTMYNLVLNDKTVPPTDRVVFDALRSIVSDLFNKQTYHHHMESNNHICSACFEK